MVALTREQLLQHIGECTRVEAQLRAMSRPDYYAILAVPRTASVTEIHQSYRNLVKQHHPDVVDDHAKKGSEEKLKAINEAYEHLSDAEKRKRYDESRGGKRSMNLSPVVPIKAAVDPDAPGAVPIFLTEAGPNVVPITLVETVRAGVVPIRLEDAPGIGIMNVSETEV
jgi:hypothetical protein